MPCPTLSARFEQALAASDTLQSLYDLAISLKAEGFSQREIVDLFDSFRANFAKVDPEPPVYDHILDTMDLLVGWGRPENRIFDSPLDDR